jgi:hypothetical protein
MNKQNILCPICSSQMELKQNYYSFNCPKCIFSTIDAYHPGHWGILSREDMNADNAPQCIGYCICFPYDNNFENGSCLSLRTDFLNINDQLMTNLYKNYKEKLLVSIPFVPLDLNDTKLSFDYLKNRLINLIPFS